jgi:DNA-binding MarR family transcriptional regulator
MPDETQSERVVEGLEGIDRLIHEPGRLAIMARLYLVEEADWLFLHHQTGLSFGNLASHLTRLEAAGYVESTKTFIDRKPHTVVHITAAGRSAFEQYREQIRLVLDPGASV